MDHEDARLEPDYDHLPIGALQYRLRTLDAASLRELRAYEAGHAARLPVLTLIDSLLAGVPGQRRGHATEVRST